MKVNMRRFAFLLILVIFSLSNTRVYSQNSYTVSYQLAWPGILPDNLFYKLKVLRNKIIAKMIIDPVDKLRFDLLNADKLIYASEILMDKNEVKLAKDTALKGEDYYSVLVHDYNNALFKNKKIPQDLDKKITMAAQKHQQVFQNLEKISLPIDKKAFEAAENFSHINLSFIVGLRNQKNKK